MGRKNSLPEHIEPLEPEPPKKVKPKPRKRSRLAGTGVEKGSRMADPIMRGERRAPKVPKNKGVAEIYEMDPDDKAFKHPQGNKRTTGNITPETSDLFDWRDVMRSDKQRRMNGRRARGRKGEAVAVKAVQVLEQGTTSEQRRKGIYDEDLAVAEGILSLDDWDDEELIRGYRRGRSGQFGPPPKFIPAEIQQELFRRIAKRGDKKMRAAYLKSIEGLVELSENGSSEKVRLEAIRELMNRVVGKIPDRVHVSQEQPWEQFLSDAIIPMGDEQDQSHPMGEAVDRPALPPPEIKDQEAGDK